MAFQWAYETDDDYNKDASKDGRVIDNPILGQIEYVGLDDAEKEHFYPKVNPNKICSMTINGTDWRDYSLGGVIIPPNMPLALDSTNFGFSYSHEFSSSPITELQQTGMIKSVLSAAQAVSSLGYGHGQQNGLLISRYSKAPMWTGSSPLQGPSSLKFTFEMGQGGVFSGLKEVVLPIISIAVKCAPYLKGNYVCGIGATKPQYTATLIGLVAKYKGTITDTLKTGAIGIASGLASSLASAASSDKEGALTALESSANAAANSLTDLADTFYSLINQTIKAHAGDAKHIDVSIGSHFTLPSMIVKNVSWDFDFKEVDEYGWPYKGSITLGGLESIEVVRQGLISGMVS